MELKNVIERLKCRQKLVFANKTLQKIVFVMVHTKLCGGSKIIIEQSNRLVERGYEVEILAPSECPDWIDVKAKFVQYPSNTDVTVFIPNCDLIVATYWSHILSCVEAGKAPVVYFEQGDEHLFHPERQSVEIRDYIWRQFQLPSYILTVSEQASNYIKENFGRDSIVVPNGFDSSVFYPLIEECQRKEPYILMVGSDSLAFKGIKNIVDAYHLVRTKYPEIRLKWIIQHEPISDWKEDIEYFVQPDKEKIAELYRHAAMYVCGSEYESFSLPILEAMASGCPVITTPNQGALEYCDHDQNAMFVPFGDIGQLSTAMTQLYEDLGKRKKLALNGLETSKRFNWSAIIDRLVEAYASMACHDVVPIIPLSDWDIYLTEAELDQLPQLIHILQYITVDEVYIPYIYKWIPNHNIARWQLAARRKLTEKNSKHHLLLPLEVDHGPQQLALGSGIALAIEERFEEALLLFVQYYNDDHLIEWRPVIAKWIAFCLLELHRDAESANVLQDALQIYSDYRDLLYLQYVLCKVNSMPEEITAELKSLISNMNESLNYPEWFWNIKNLI